MSRRGLVINMASTLLICAAVIVSAQPAMACSVCYGDPNSPLSHGAQAGMLVLLGVIGVVLTGLASLLLFWMRRAANLEELGREVGKASGAWATESRGS